MNYRPANSHDDDAELELEVAEDIDGDRYDTGVAAAWVANTN